MKKLHYHIANANGSLDKFVPQIKEAFEKAEQYAVPKLKIKNDIDIIVSDVYRDFIPEIHIGGYTHRDDFITIAIDSSAKAVSVDDLFQMICHELCHATRWQYNPEYADTLLKTTVFEGIATAFEMETCKDNKIQPEFFAKSITERTDEKNENILSLLKNELDKEKYDYNKIFFDGNEELPRWAGYSVGYCIVKKYLSRTNKKPSDIFADKYKDFQI